TDGASVSTRSVTIVQSLMLIVFFSSRRRHTRSKRDWSSDVCSSDLHRDPQVAHALIEEALLDLCTGLGFGDPLGCEPGRLNRTRSEERRVGKDWRQPGETLQEK